MSPSQVDPHLLLVSFSRHIASHAYKPAHESTDIDNKQMWTPTILDTQLIKRWQSLTPNSRHRRGHTILIYTICMGTHCCAINTLAPEKKGILSPNKSDRPHTLQGHTSFHDLETLFGVSYCRGCCPGLRKADVHIDLSASARRLTVQKLHVVLIEIMFAENHS